MTVEIPAVAPVEITEKNAEETVVTQTVQTVEPSMAQTEEKTVGFYAENQEENQTLNKVEEISGSTVENVEIVTPDDYSDIDEDEVPIDIYDKPPADLAEQDYDDMGVDSAVEKIAAEPVKTPDADPAEKTPVKKAPEAGPMRISVADNQIEKNKVLQNSAVQQILDIFGGELADVHVDRKRN